MRVLRGDAQKTTEEELRWLWLAWLVAAEVWDDEAWSELAASAVGLARESGALTILPIALHYRAGVHIHAGEFAAAATLIEEADTITDATGNAPARYGSLLLVAWQGEEPHASSELARGLDDASTRGEGRAIGLDNYFLATLLNGQRRYAEALAAAQVACEHDDLGVFGFALVELIEAAVRSTSPDVAVEALRALEARTVGADTDWALGVLARSRALLSTDALADSLYQESIERLGRTRIVVHLARAHLIYGEWLRREHRRIEARDQLRVAHEMFDGMGAGAFAERAHRELRATGATALRRSVPPQHALTAREAQVAALAGQGHTNAEIGSQLFIGARTVEYHLKNVFTKLSISSRRELQGALTMSETPRR